MSTGKQTVCPGCGLRMPASATAIYDGYFNVTAECWSVFTEVVGKEFANAVLFGQVHQLTVDAYAVQHAGGGHPDKSVAIHLSGLHLALERAIRPPEIPRRLQRIAATTETWPHFAPPERRGTLTVCDVAFADGPSEHAEVVRRWAAEVWHAFAAHHDAVARFVAARLSRSSNRAVVQRQR